MVRIRQGDNPNTKQYWVERHSKGEGGHNSSITAQVERFFIYGMLPGDQKISVLDIGCGDATYTKGLKEKFPLVEWHGVDFSTTAIEKNRGYGNGTFYEIDLNSEIDKLKNIGVVFDYVISMQTFEHLDSPGIVLEACLSICKNAVICVPCEGYWDGEETHIHNFPIKGSELSGFVSHKTVAPGPGSPENEVFLVYKGKHP